MSTPYRKEVGSYDMPGLRRGLVARPKDWIWSSARFYAGNPRDPILMDALPCLDG